MKKLLVFLLIIITFFTCRKESLIYETSQKVESITSEEVLNKKDRSNEILVEFINKNSVNISSIGQVMKIIHTSAMKRDNYPEIHIIKVADVSKALEGLKHNPNVKWASPNYQVSNDQTYPNDPNYTTGSMWGMQNINASPVWQVNKGSQAVYIGIIDEGIMYWHEDLCGQVWQNPFEVDGDGVDNDGNGYIDDMHGWDFLNNDNTIFDGTDDHGTHVAGTIGAKGNNSKGVIGVSPNVTMISAKFLEGSGYISDAIEAMDYITDLKTRHGLNIPATSNSWGGGGFTQGFYDAIERAKNADILFVAAAGNNANNNDIYPFYPSSMTNDNVIAVAAITSADAMSSFSNYGATTVDIGAPGSTISSTLFGTGLISIYGNYSGTSMATPHVSGAVALYKTSHPASTYTQIKSAILSNARSIAALNGKVSSNGTLNIGSFTTPYSENYVNRNCVVPPIDYTPPTPPQNMRYTATETSATIIWDPAIDLESKVNEYRITQYNITSNPTGFTSGLSMTFYTVGPGRTYKFIGWATNMWNLTSVTSDTLYVTTPGTYDGTPPTMPGNFHFIAPGDDRVTYGWEVSTDNHSVNGYYMENRELGDLNFTTGRTILGGYTTQATAINLNPGTTYEFRLQAFDASGNRSAWTPWVIGYTTGADIIPPSIPVGLSIDNISSTSMRVNWNASTDNIAVIGYDVYFKASTDLFYQSVSAGNVTNYTKTGLIPSTSYNYYVVAKDGAGNVSGLSSVITGTTLAPPPPDTINPIINITKPLNGYTIPSKGNKNVTIVISASDNIGVTRTEIWIDGNLIPNATNLSTYKWNSNNASKGAHVITAKAFDAAGNTATSPAITVYK